MQHSLERLGPVTAPVQTQPDLPLSQAHTACNSPLLTIQYPFWYFPTPTTSPPGLTDLFISTPYSHEACTPPYSCPHSTPAEASPRHQRGPAFGRVHEVWRSQNASCSSTPAADTLMRHVDGATRWLRGGRRHVARPEETHTKHPSLPCACSRSTARS